METRTCSGDVGAHTGYLRLERSCHLKRAGYGHCPSLGSGRRGQLHRLGRVRELLHRLGRVRELRILLQRMELRSPIEPPLLLVALLLKLLRHLLRALELKLLVLPLEQLELQKLLLQLVDALRGS